MSSSWSRSSSRSRGSTSAVLVAALLLSACGTEPPAAAPAEERAPEAPATVAPAPAPASPTPPPPPAPEPEPAYAPPEDWYEQALATADVARRAVVAIGWDPPGMLRRRLEAGWLAAPDLVITSNAVACEAQEGRDLRVRTFDGTILRATIERIVGACEQMGPGLAHLRLSRSVDAPTLLLRGGSPPEVGEPLMAIGHANHAAAVGGWLVMVGPMVRTEGDLLVADIGAPVSLGTFDQWFGGGSNGAPVIDLAGDVVAVLCCVRQWGPQLRYDDPLAEPVLRTRVTVDQRFYSGGIWGGALQRAMD